MTSASYATWDPASANYWRNAAPAVTGGDWCSASSRIRIRFKPQTSLNIGDNLELEVCVVNHSTLGNDGSYYDAPNKGGANAIIPKDKEILVRAPCMSSQCLDLYQHVLQFNGWTPSDVLCPGDNCNFQPSFDPDPAHGIEGVIRCVRTKWDSP